MKTILIILSLSTLAIADGTSQFNPGVEQVMQSREEPVVKEAANEEIVKEREKKAKENDEQMKKADQIIQKKKSRPTP